MPCNYSVDSASILNMTGTIPSWLQGSYYHAIMFTKTVNAAGRAGDNTLGAVVSLSSHATAALQQLVPSTLADSINLSSSDLCSAETCGLADVFFLYLF